MGLGAIVVGDCQKESYPCDTGNFVIKSNAIVSKGSACGRGMMGYSGARYRTSVDLCLDIRQPFTYSWTSRFIPGHQ